MRKYRIINNKLYCGKEYIGFVRYIDYRDNGRHGYAIGKVKDHSLLEEFQSVARRLFPDAENPYIEFLDMLYK